MRRSTYVHFLQKKRRSVIIESGFCKNVHFFVVLQKIRVTSYAFFHFFAISHGFVLPCKRFRKFFCSDTNYDALLQNRPYLSLLSERILQFILQENANVTLFAKTMNTVTRIPNIFSCSASKSSCKAKKSGI